MSADLNDKMVAATSRGGWLGDLTDEQVMVLISRRHARWVETTGRWLLTDAGMDAARKIGDAA